jgi:hypothetical protein
MEFHTAIVSIFIAPHQKELFAGARIKMAGSQLFGSGFS